MAKQMIFTATGTQSLADPPYTSQLVGAKLIPSAAAAVSIYDGTSSSGVLVWELKSVSGEPDYDDILPDGIAMSSGSMYVDFTSGAGTVIALVK